MVLKIFSDTLDKTDNFIVYTGVSNRRDIIWTDGGVSSAVFRDDESRMPGDSRRNKQRQRLITIDLAFPGECDPTINIEFPESLDGLFHFSIDEHINF